MKIFSNFLCLVLLTVCTFSVSLTLATRRSYGEECNRTNKCDKAAWLSCRNGKCECSKSEEMLYNAGMGKCLTKSGERCKYGADSEESVLVELTDCVPNSVCIADGVCQCNPKYHETYNGTCGMSALLGEKCTEEDQCSKFVGLHCVDSKCECKDGIYSVKKELCVGRSQSVCLRNECVDGAICVKGKCICDSEHFHSSEKTCLPKKKLLEDCNRDVECLQTDTLKLLCISGKCNCSHKFVYSSVQKYEYSIYNRFQTLGYFKPFPFGFTGPFVEVCAPKIGQNCPNGYCVEDAFCDARAQKSYTAPISGLCRCINNQHTPSKNLEYCASIKNQECTADSDCIDDLLCFAGKCNCPSPGHQFFDYTRNTCVTKIGGHCTTESTCVPDSSCVYLSSSSNSRSGHCECNANFVVNKDRNCELAYGADCTEDGLNCDTFAGLMCINKKCSCPDTMYEYNARFRKCLGLVGASCNKTEEIIICGKNVDSGSCRATSHSKLVCIEDAYCNGVGPLESCVCADNYVETNNHTCVTVAEAQSHDNEEIERSRSGVYNYNTIQNITYDGNDNCDYLHMCKNGQCIRKEWVCDGILQCDDNSDEIECPRGSNVNNTGDDTDNFQMCDFYEFWTCRSGECIERSNFCNAVVDCEDGSDEPEGCQNTEECSDDFKCWSTDDCVRRHNLCNGIEDCSDGSDEKVCAI